MILLGVRLLISNDSSSLENVRPLGVDTELGVEGSGSVSSLSFSIVCNTIGAGFSGVTDFIGVIDFTGVNNFSGVTGFSDISGFSGSLGSDSILLVDPTLISDGDAVVLKSGKAFGKNGLDIIE